MTRHVLIADDDPTIRSLVRAYLTDPYTTCSEAADGAAAVRLAGECRPDAVLLDVEMPNMDGFEACRALKADPWTRPIPVLFLTAQGDVPDVVRGLDLGAAGYVTKPFDADELSARVRSALRARREVLQAEDRAGRDEATGLFNRTYLGERLSADLAASRRWGQPLACCVASPHAWDDLVADRGGGEAILASVARTLVAVLRQEDVACRYDDRAVAVLGFASDPKAAIALGQRVQAAIGVALAKAGATGPAAAVDVGVALSHQSAGDALLFHAAEAHRHARLSEPGTVQFGGELADLRLADRPLN